VLAPAWVSVLEWGLVTVEALGLAVAAFQPLVVEVLEPVLGLVGHRKQAPAG